jgi:hypothetical protein
LSGTLRIETKADWQGMGQNLLQVAVWWKAQEPALDSQLVPIEEWGFENSFIDVHDPSAAQGLILAHQIIQRHSGSFQLLTTNDVIFGFQIQLPLSLPYDQENSFASFRIPSLPLKPVKLTPGKGHLFS